MAIRPVDGGRDHRLAAADVDEALEEQVAVGIAWSAFGMSRYQLAFHRTCSVMRLATVTDSGTVSSSSTPASAERSKMSFARRAPSTVSSPEVGFIRPARVIIGAVRPGPAGHTSTLRPQVGIFRSTGPYAGHHGPRTRIPMASTAGSESVSSVYAGRSSACWDDTALLGCPRLDIAVRVSPCHVNMRICILRVSRADFAPEVPSGPAARTARRAFARDG